MEYLRIIPRLDIKSGNLIKGINLEGLRVLGDPNKFALEYYNQNADELLFMDDERRSFNLILISQDQFREMVEIPQNFIDEEYESYVKPQVRLQLGPSASYPLLFYKFQRTPGASPRSLVDFPGSLNNGCGHVSAGLTGHRSVHRTQPTNTDPTTHAWIVAKNLASILLGC